jgi:hypothetical protein
MMPATRPTPRQPKKLVPGGSFGNSKTLDDRYLFGTQSEINDREATGYNLGGTPPETAVPSFQQIRPGPTGKDANDPSPVHYSGDNKYGNHRRYR